MTEPPAGRGQRRRRTARRDQGPPAAVTDAAAVTKGSEISDSVTDPSIAAPAASAGSQEAGPANSAEPPRSRRADRLRSRHRNRQTAAAAAAAAETTVEAPISPAIEHHPSPAPVSPAPARSAPRTTADRRAELADRALRGLVTSRGTQVSWSAGIRARDVARPTAQDMADAEAEVVIVRRNYTPPEPLGGARGTPEVTGKQRRGADRSRPRRDR